MNAYVNIHITSIYFYKEILIIVYKFLEKSEFIILQRWLHKMIFPEI